MWCDEVAPLDNIISSIKLKTNLCFMTSKLDNNRTQEAILRSGYRLVTPDDFGKCALHT